MAMFRLFQVNKGHYLQLDRDVAPTSRVSDLCGVVEEKVRGEGVDGLVLLTANGQQMESSKVIGAYPIGTENKPIFVFFQSYLLSPSPPHTQSRISSRPELEGEWQLLNQKPNSSNFQSQVILAKHFADHASRLSAVVLDLQVEFDLQCKGWSAVLTNCKTIFRTYQKHQKLFCKSVESFQAANPRYLQLLLDFPSQVELLHGLPVPSTAAPRTSSLYDWISTHDERNSLMDLSTECQKALVQADDKQVQQAIVVSEQILTSTNLSCLDQLGEGGLPRLQQLAEKATELIQIQTSLAQNMQSTSQRAMRNGDASTVADLVVSHQKCLQLLLEQNLHLEAHVRDMESMKANLTLQIHRKLQMVTEIQQKISESNTRLLFLHEHIKLAKKRFEILEQVYHTPTVLGKVICEVERRRTFQREIEQQTGKLATNLVHHYEVEKRERKAFKSSHSHHFTLTLFPELQHPMPEFACQVLQPHSASASLLTDTELALLKDKLPPDLCPSPKSHSPIPESDAFESSTQASLFHSSHSQLDTSSQTSDFLLEKQTDEQQLADEVRRLKGETEESKRQLLEKEESLKQEKSRHEELLSQSRTSAENEMCELRKHLSYLNQTLREEIEGWKEKCRQQREALEGLAGQMKMKEENLKLKEGELDEARDQAAHMEARLQDEIERMRQESDDRVAGREGLIAELNAKLVQAEKKRTEAAKDWAAEQRSLTEALRVLELQAREKEHDSEKHVETLRGQLSQDETKARAVNEQLQQKLHQAQSTMQSLQEDKDTEISRLTKRLKEQGKKLTGTERTVQEINAKWEAECELLRRSIAKKEQANKTFLVAQEESARQREREISDLRQGLASVKKASKEEAEKYKLQLVEARKTAEHLQRTSRERMEEKMEEISKLTNKLVQAKAFGEQVRKLSEECSQLKKEVERKQQAMQQTMEGQMMECRSVLEQAVAKAKSAQEKVEQIKLKLSDKSKAVDGLHRERKEIQHLLKVAEERLEELKGKLLQAEKLKDADEHLRQEPTSKESTIEILKHRVIELETAVAEHESGTGAGVVTDAENTSEVECKELRVRSENLLHENEEQRKELQREASRRQQAQAALNNLRAQLEHAKKRVESGEEERVRLRSDLDEALEERKTLEQETASCRMEAARSSNRDNPQCAGEMDRPGVPVESQLMNRLEQQLSEAQTSLDESQHRFDLRMAQLEVERDEYMKHSMEMERELKQVQRAIGGSSPLGPPPQLPPQSSQPTQASAQPPAEIPLQKTSVSGPTLRVAISNLQMGDLALFTADQYKNFLALAVDGKTYYLNQGSASSFTQDVAGKAHGTLHFGRKLLLGRITNKLFVEVRKEGNRLRVPVGHRLYKVDAEEVLV